ncbi:peptidoglycan-binding protein LysM [Lacinutrix sp. Bg11-31]|uniref:peptidoglycan-binding protein LysM n=1 Tax=Lacinutrix sp. Bg11-31 TaxID=2057808 RepID=UPI000C308300|nr:peptidoglycan-binding protein LysM [Lacinutrix sp. Bg11-31]AUC81937.1 peptidoglycan-binding protein LysM [Lacinutrix sp. Bg11-31]
MNKKSIAKLVSLAFTICILIIVSLSNNSNIKEYALLEDDTIEVQQLDNTIVQEKTVSVSSIGYKNVFSPELGKSFTGFKEKLGFKESQNDYFRVNTLGYLGKYQFGRSTLELIGINDTKHFLNTPELQEKAFIANAERNKWVLRRDIKRFVGKSINGIEVTESGILAAAHLAGPGGVKKYLRSYGSNGFEDAYGTSIKNYMKRFQGYDTSRIIANKKAKVLINV